MGMVMLVAVVIPGSSVLVFDSFAKSLPSYGKAAFNGWFLMLFVPKNLLLDAINFCLRFCVNSAYKFGIAWGFECVI